MGQGQNWTAGWAAISWWDSSIEIRQHGAWGIPAAPAWGRSVLWSGVSSLIVQWRHSRARPCSWAGAAVQAWTWSRWRSVLPRQLWLSDRCSHLPRPCREVRPWRWRTGRARIPIRPPQRPPTRTPLRWRETAPAGWPSMAGPSALGWLARQRAPTFLPTQHLRWLTFRVPRPRSRLRPQRTQIPRRLRPRRWLWIPRFALLFRLQRRRFPLDWRRLRPCISRERWRIRRHRTCSGTWCSRTRATPRTPTTTPPIPWRWRAAQTAELWIRATTESIPHRQRSPLPPLRQEAPRQVRMNIFFDEIYYKKNKYITIFEYLEYTKNNTKKVK